MKKSIIITTINSPTDAVIAYSKFDLDYNLIVVGDKKTPQNWYHNYSDYISIDDQVKSSFELSKHLPFNHYSRKMIGYLEAIKAGADVIIDTDDDNVPYKKWGFPKFKGRFDTIQNIKGFINIYQMFTSKKIWPRGLPLKLINTWFGLESFTKPKFSKIGIWQGLADGDPDVDAIYRLTDDSECIFNSREPIVLDEGVISPFNSQNTCFASEVFPLLYLPAYVTFRFTDILRGLVAQPIMWLYGYRLGFIEATVFQERNPHDYMNDFESEIPMYLNADKIIKIIENSISKEMDISDNMMSAYQALEKEGIVLKKEINTLSLWLSDLKTLRDNS